MEHYDVTVVGAGLAGCCAALSAAEQGARVLLLEKQPAPGGSSLLSAGGMAFSGVAPQRNAGIEDDPQRLRADLERIGRGFGDPSLVETYVGQQAATFDWLCGVGVQFSSVQTGSGNSVPRVVRTDTAQVFSALSVALDARGVVRRTGNAVQRLRAGAGNKVQGVKLASAATEEDIGSDAVVLATGGFSRNPELVRTFAPDMLRAVPVGGDGSTGDGLRMACALGAGLRDMGFVRATFGSHPSARGAVNLMLHPIYKGAIIVDADGRRFVDESRPYKELGDALLAQPQAAAWQVFDQTVMDQADPLAGTYDFQGALARGLVVQAESLELLAERTGIAAAGLRETIADYNAGVSSQRPDRQGRTGLPGGKPLTPIARPPFYAYASTVVLLATYCGVAIDARARVLDVFGHPIEGLYAAGELTGGLHGAGYLSGTSLGKSAIFGRIAGREAAGAARARLR